MKRVILLIALAGLVSACAQPVKANLCLPPIVTVPAGASVDQSVAIVLAGMGAPCYQQTFETTAKAAKTVMIQYGSAMIVIEGLEGNESAIQRALADKIPDLGGLVQ